MHFLKMSNDSDMWLRDSGIEGVRHQSIKINFSQLSFSSIYRSYFAELPLEYNDSS